jgi:hypothetical protein
MWKTTGLLLLGLLACGALAETPLGSQRDAEHLRRRAARSCSNEALVEHDFESEFRCAELLNASGDVDAATRHWLSAFTAAGRRAEQCEVIRRIERYTLRPEEALAQTSSDARHACR